MIGDRPGYIPKTDETRIQSAPELLNEFKGLPYYITTKMDGSSHSIGVRDGEISFTGHNFTYKDDGKSAFVEHVKTAGIPEKMKAYAEEICRYVGCQIVPVEEEGDDLLAKYPDEAALLARAEGVGYNGTIREGIVIRPVTPVHSYTLSGPLSMKVINNKYLMKNDE